MVGEVVVVPLMTVQALVVVVVVSAVAAVLDAVACPGTPITVVWLYK
jgi:hypothetical protein